MTASRLAHLIDQMYFYGLSSVQGGNAWRYIVAYCGKESTDFIGMPDLVATSIEKFALEAHQQIESARVTPR